MKLSNFLRRLHWILSSQFGLDLRILLRSIKGILRFFNDYRKFKISYGGKLSIVPCLHDWYEEGGATKNEYFWQDLIVSRTIYKANPNKHVDIGSRVDGFVAHVASFREIEIFDVRDISVNIPGVIFKKIDFMGDIAQVDYCDSISCLHALEHFGLGRYGDPINPNGPTLGLENMAKTLKYDGVLYLSIPIGIERVEFNANRIFNPSKLIATAERMSLQFQSLTAIYDSGVIEEIHLNSSRLKELAEINYSLGLFIFRKI